MTRIAVPASVESLEPFVELDVLDAADVHFAAMLDRLSPQRPSVLLAAALAVRSPRYGHIGLDPFEVGGSIVPRDPEADIDGLPWPDPVDWVSEIQSSDLVQTGTKGGHRVLPLVWEHGLLYLHRHWRSEVEVAASINIRSQADRPFVSGDTTAILDRVLGDESDENRQRSAVETALQRPLTVIAGGPGTGKTFTVARLLTVLLELRPNSELDIALAAPTGKAAARMTEAVQMEVAKDGVDPAVASKLSVVEASTIHRMLKPRGPGRFFHNRSNPLPHDIIVVDEMSMVSLPLMASFLEAVAHDARLVLVGDPAQLASIEAGSVLRDLVDAPQSGASNNTVVLDRMHRFGAESVIARFAKAIHMGDATEALNLLNSGEENLQWVKHSATTEIADLRTRAVENAGRVEGAAKSGDAEAALSYVSELKILSAQRRGPKGVFDWNKYIEDTVRSGWRSGEDWYIGRPVMVTNNDYRAGLFNGDVGVVMDHEDVRQVAFPSPDGIRYFEPSRLEAVDTLWAMTIHKSQGSEFDEVVVSLPEDWSPLLTRELLYTAVTRAKEKVVLLASAEALEKAITTALPRFSRLGVRLGHAN